MVTLFVQGKQNAKMRFHTLMQMAVNFLRFSADRPGLARVSLTLWTCSAVGEEPLVKRMTDDNQRVKYLIFKARQGLPSVPSSKTQSDFTIFEVISQSDFELQKEKKSEITFENASGKLRFRLL